MIDPAIMGQWIQMGREYRALEIPELAAQLGVEPAAIEAWEAGQARPERKVSRDQLRQLARALRFPVGFFTQPEAPHLITGFCSLDVHGFEIICDACDQVIDPLDAQVNAGLLDFHAHCAPTTA